MEAALLMFLSKYNTVHSTPREYRGVLPDGTPVTLSGIQTNDAPCHYLLRCALCAGDRISHILCITSKEDIQPVLPGAPNSLEYFQRSLAGIIASDDALQRLYDGAPPQVVSVPYDYADGGLEENQRAGHLYSRISDFFAGDGMPRKVYIEYTGGPRDTTFLLTELTRFLKYGGVACGQIAYSNFQEKRLVSLNQTYHMFELLSGINDFVSYGKADTLRSIYAHRNNPVVDQLLLNLTRFSEVISLCALDGIDDILAQIQTAVTQMEEYRLRPEDDMSISMLKDFLPRIREKFPLGDRGDTGSLRLIRWCLDNGLLQQALILYTEKIPKLCFSAGLLKESVIDTGYVSGSGKTEAVYGMYECLFRRIRDMGPVGEFCRYLKRVQVCKKEDRLSYPKAMRACLESGDWSPACRKGAEFFIRTVDQCYDPKDGARTEAGKAIRFYGKDFQAKNMVVFITNTLAEEQMQHYFVYNDAQMWKEKQESPYRDLLKKMEALDVLRADPALDVSQFSDRLTAPQLYELMAFYFAVKMLRNHASHASGSISPTIRYCYEQGLIRSLSVDYATVRETLDRAERMMSGLLD